MNETTQRPLPPSWRWVRLGEMCELVGDSINPLAIPDATFAHYSIPAFDAGQKPVIELGATILSNKVRFPNGAVLFSKLNPRIARVWYVADNQPNRRICSTEFLPLLPNLAGLDPDYLTFVLQEPRLIAGLRACVQAATKSRERLRPEMVLSTEIPLPPLTEQRRIVAILSEQMAAVERARKAAQARLEAAKALPAAYLRAVFSSPEAQQWPRVRLGEVCDVVNGFGFSEHLQGRKGLPYPFVKVSDMNAQGAEVVVSKALNTVDKSILSSLGAKTYPAGTIVFPKVGGALLTNKKRVLGVEATFDNNVMGLVPKAVDQWWLFYWMQTVDLRELANTQALPSIRQSEVAALEIPLPPLSEQQRIIAILSEQMAAVERARKGLQGELDTINKLPAALLRRAFNGGL